MDVSRRVDALASDLERVLKSQEETARRLEQSVAALRDKLNDLRRILDEVAPETTQDDANALAADIRVLRQKLDEAQPLLQHLKATQDAAATLWRSDRSDNNQRLLKRTNMAALSASNSAAFVGLSTASVRPISRQGAWRRPHHKSGARISHRRFLVFFRRFTSCALHSIVLWAAVHRGDDG